MNVFKTISIIHTHSLSSFLLECTFIILDRNQVDLKHLIFPINGKKKKLSNRLVSFFVPYEG